MFLKFLNFYNCFCKIIYFFQKFSRTVYGLSPPPQQKYFESQTAYVDNAPDSVFFYTGSTPLRSTNSWFLPY